MNYDYDLIVVGAGPSSIYLNMYLDKNIKVLIIDKNDMILKKFLLSGNGKANITNSSDHQTLLNNMIYGTKNFMYYSFNKYNSNHILEFLDKLNIKYKSHVDNPNKIHLIETNKVFIRKIENILNSKENVDILLNTSVQSIDKKSEIFYIKTPNKIFTSKIVVVATGGLSFSKFANCIGDGYKIAKDFGHTINQTFPMGISLDLNMQLPQLENMFGNSINNVNIKVIFNKKILIDENGSVMVTHKGIGGPLVRRISGYITYNKNNNDLYILISFINKNKLVEHLNKIKKISELWKEFNCFTKKFISNLYEKLNINALTDVKNLSNNDKNKIINFLCDFKINIKDIKNLNNFEPAINTGGGVNTKEIDSNTFMSKIVNNLFFIGEVLDVNAKTGGFNLTVCFSSARVCSDAINNFLINNNY